MRNVFDKLLKAELIIIGSPLYYGNVSGLTKSLIDRTIPAYENELLKGKKLISIMVGGGETKITAKFHKEAIRGFVKYNKLKLLKIFNFQGFEANDLRDDPSAMKEISKIIKSALADISL
jgi:multimeric flavodoxin WrbA